MLEWHVWHDGKEIKWNEIENAPVVKGTVRDRFTVLQPGDALSANISIDQRMRLLAYKVAAVGDPVHGMAIGKEVIGKFNVPDRGEVQAAVEYKGDSKTYINAFVTVFPQTPKDLQMYYGTVVSNRLRLR